MNEKTMDWTYDSMCFACGEQNPIGLHLKFEKVDEETARTTFVPGQVHQSWPGIMHGGLTALIADELMGRCVNVLGYAGVTARMELRYKHAVPLEETVTFEAKVVHMRLPIIDLEARAILADGSTALEASARFMVKARYEEFIAQLAEGQETL